MVVLNNYVKPEKKIKRMELKIKCCATVAYVVNKLFDEKVDSFTACFISTFILMVGRVITTCSTLN